MDLMVEVLVSGIEANQACESFAEFGPVGGAAQPDVHRTNRGLWNGPLAGAIPDQALIQRCLQSPAGPLNVLVSHASVHQALAPVELRIFCIHQHVVAISDGVVDGAMQMGFHFRPRALHRRVPPQLFPQSVNGDHPCGEQRSRDRGEGGLAPPRGADQEMAL